MLNKAHPSLFGGPFSSRASFELVGSAAGLEQELLAIEGANIGGSCPCRLMLTDEVLLDEASRYSLHHKRSLVSLGIGVFSSSTPFLGPVYDVMGT